MASHRKPRTPMLQSPTARRSAVTVSTAALASVTLLAQGAQAAPEQPDDKPSIEDVQKQVDALYRQAGTATQRYNAAKERTDTQREKVDLLLDKVAERTGKLNEARRTLGTLATAQYRNGGLSETATLLLSEDPQGFFGRQHVVDRLTEQQRQAVEEYREQQQSTAEKRAEAARSLRTLTASQQRLSTTKKTVQSKLTEARELLAQLTAEERERLAELERERQEEARRKAAAAAKAEQQRAAAEAEQQQSQQQAAEQSTNPGTDAGSADSGTTSRAQQVVAFARAQLGKPYVWGATGPDSYDCSGLTRAAWQDAGISLPRTTFDQVNAGTKIAKSDMRPGDLVFFYDDVSHVGIYIGGGEMIHAPKPGTNVRVEAVDYMPFHSAVRPG